MDAGITAGGGVSLNFGRHIIQAGPAFSMGFINVNKYPDGRPDDEKPNFNAVIAVLNVTYLFKTKD